MNKFLLVSAATIGLLCAAATSGSAQVARPDGMLKAQGNDNNIVQAQFRGGFRGGGFHGGGFRGGWRGGGWGYRGGYYRGWGPGIGLGIAGGALLGGALAAPYYYGGYYGGAPYYDDGYYGGAAPAYSGGGGVAYCMQRYRSYDAVSGTFLGYDGLRHPCP